MADQSETNLPRANLSERLRLIGEGSAFPGRSVYDEAARGIDAQAAEIERLRTVLEWISAEAQHEAARGGPQADELRVEALAEIMRRADAALHPDAKECPANG